MDVPPPIPLPPVIPLAASHPPMAPGVLPPPRSAWVTVFGIVAIVFGVLGFLGGLLGLIGPLIFGHMRFPQPGGTSFDPFAAMADWRPWLIAIGVLSAAIAAMLVLEGILLMSRKPAARAIALGWAIAKMVIVVASTYVSFHLQQAQLASMQQAGMSLAGMQGLMSIMGMVGMVFAIVWGWALPIFTLVWFLRPTIRKEVASW